MADIKTRDAVKGTIKTIDKAAVASERMKSAYSKIKSKAEQGYYADENSATEYAADKVSAASERITDEGVHQFNKQGQKGVKTTKDNVVKAKDKISEFKQKRAAKAAEQRMSGNSVQTYRSTISRSADKAVKGAQQTEKTIKQTARSGKKTVKTAAKGTVKTTQKSVKTAQATSKAAIKTAEHTAKATQAAAKASVKAAQRAAQAARATAKATIVAVKAAVKATIAAVKAIIAGTKALIAAIAAGGWIAMSFPLLISIIAGLNLLQEEKASYFQNVLAVSNRSDKFLSKLIVLYGAGAISLSALTAFFILGISLAGKAETIQIGLLVKAVLGIAVGNLIIYILHLFLSFKFGIGISLFWGVFETLQCIMYSNIELHGITRLIPFSWAVNLMHDMLDRSGNIMEFAVILLLTVVVLILTLIWFNNWEGRKNYE